MMIKSFRMIIVQQVQRENGLGWSKRGEGFRKDGFLGSGEGVYGLFDVFDGIERSFKIVRELGMDQL